MGARATQRINSSFGTFDTGQAIDGVPDEVLEAWRVAGIVDAESPEPETATAPPRERAVGRRQRTTDPHNRFTRDAR